MHIQFAFLLSEEAKCNHSISSQSPSTHHKMASYLLLHIRNGQDSFNPRLPPSVSQTSDFYHHPDSFYAVDVLINLTKKHTGLEPGARYRCVVRDVNGNWVIKDNSQTYQVVTLSQFLNIQHASGAVYQVPSRISIHRNPI